MENKTIKVSRENYLRLLRKYGELQKEMDRPVSFDVVIDFLLDSSEGKCNINKKSYFGKIKTLSSFGECDRFEDRSI